MKDFDEYSFKPQETVSHICQIYLNLSESDEFCLAVSRDGRSYSRDLFVQAEKVLHRIHKPMDMIMHFTEVSAKIKVIKTHLLSCWKIAMTQDIPLALRDMFIKHKEDVE